jgi:hypothetical protein
VALKQRDVESPRVDNPKAEVQFFDTGHFLETHARDITAAIRRFPGKLDLGAS